MPLILEIIDKMATESYEEEGICYTNAPLDLFRFINEFFLSFQSAPYPEVANALLGLIFK